MNKELFNQYCQAHYPNQSHSELWNFVDQILNKYNPATVIEIGTSEGGSAVFWNYFCEKNNGYFITIDIDITDKPRGKLSGSSTPVYFIEGKSQNIQVIDQVHKIVQHKVDFIYIDGDHAEEPVYQDIKNYMFFLRTGGIMAFHDAKRPTDGPALAIARAKEDGLIKCTEEFLFDDFTREDMGTYYFIKE